MPYRNGRVVNWKTRIEGFAEIIGDEELATDEKLVKLSSLIQDHPAFGDEDFSDQLEEVSQIDNEYEREAAGNSVISEIYNYADDNLIWLGVT